uniref:SusC/RagA family TonB-linked outer membrane protein n=1 Tax=Alistipes megaguti TaxID=2364787 RepID=UPI000EFC2752|nr:SusC/RagA family TonB-linked outer membrane protein [Alistipes megaguti]
MKLHLSIKQILRSVALWTACGLPLTLPAAGRDSLRISVAYGSQQEWERTEAQSSVSGEELLRTTSANVGNALQGRLPGLTLLQQSAEPGYDFDITNLAMRGRTTYTDNSRMLVFVDGFESTIESLTASEIESVTLLKDAAALVLYGMRGANGVLLVTTKRGLDSRPDIKVRIQSGIQQAMALPDPVDSYTYASLHNLASANDERTPLYGQQALDAYRNGSDPYLYPNVNWKEQMLRKIAPLTTADISFRGGNRIVKYYLLVGLTNNQGYYKGTDSKRRENSNAYYNAFNIRSNIDINITKRLSAALSFGGCIGDRSVPGGGSSAYSLLSSIYTTPPNAFPVRNPDGSLGGSSLLTNPVGELLYRGVYRENSRTFQLVFTPRYQLDFITRGLSLSASVAYNNYMADSSVKNRNYARYALSPGENAGEYVYTQYGADEPLEASEGFRTDWSRINFRVSLDYDRSFGRHDVSAGAFFLTDKYREYAVRSDMKYVNFAARATYSYDKRYIAQIAASYTGCDDFAPGHRFGLFPAVSVGWVLSNESWLKPAESIEYLKLRASVGLVGNNRNDAGRYLYDESYASTGSYLLGTGSSATGAFGSTIISNPALTCEKELIANVGLDAEFGFGLYLSADYFDRRRTGIVDQAEATTPGFIGASSSGILPYMNVGEVRNRGFELTLGWEKRSRAVTWSAEASVWYARNEILDMGEAARLYDYQYRKGHPAGTPFVLVADGLYQKEDFNADGSLADGLPVPQYGAVKPGDIKYVNQNDDQVIDSYDAVPVGYSELPEWNYAFTGRLSWKGLELELLFHGVAHRDLYLSGPTVWSFQDNGSASALARDSWTADNTDASYPRLSLSEFDNNYRTSTFWRRNGGYLRLKNLYLAYNIPSRKAAGQSKVCVYFNGTNLLTWSDLGDLADPESNDLITYPLARTYSLGLKFTF